MSYIDELGKKAGAVKDTIAQASTVEKNAILEKIAEELVSHTDEIIAANQEDIKNAKDNGISDTMVDRLRLTKERVEGIADACIQLTGMEDPIGQVLEGSVRPNGMEITKVRVPLGVVGMIYESRPNVTVDVAALCIKSGNAAILRGGKEAIHSNQMLVKIIQQAIKACGYPAEIVQLVEDTSHESANAMMRANAYIDVLIPRGSARLIKAVVENATVPAIETGTGNCHIYISDTADLAMGVSVTDNGKTQRPSVCNALENCLVHEAVAEKFLPMLKEKLDEHQVEIYGCEKTKAILGDCVKEATEEEYAQEFLDYAIAIKVVPSTEDAIAHINKYTTHHSECIITNSYKDAQNFQKRVDAACVYVNCSTRFTDGGEFGLGAEIGISTQKLHARGPMGLAVLTTTKYLIRGEGQIRE